MNTEGLISDKCDELFVTFKNMKNEINQLGTIFNLSDYESAIYLCLQKQGALHIKNIGKHASIPRTAIYEPLEKLIRKGLASETIFGKRKYYSATPLRVLRHMLDQKRASLENMIRDISGSKQIISEQAQLEASIYFGSEGIKSAGLIFLDETKQKNWHSFENLGLTTERVGLEFEDFYVQERVKRGIKSKMIVSMTDENNFVKKLLKEDTEQLRETVMLSPHQYPFQTTVVATKGVALIINPGQTPFALIIRNDEIADTFIKMHECIWDRYVK